MGCHGRQQLLKPARHSRRSGQAIVELLPSIIIFFTVIVAALNYFRVMRAAVIRQEAVRNSVFAVINNSGTLTTPPNLLQDPTATALKPVGVIEGGSQALLSSAQFVAGTSRCFTIYPADPVRNVEAPLLSFFSGAAGGGTPTVSFLTYGVIARQPGGNCAR